MRFFKRFFGGSTASQYVFGAGSNGVGAIQPIAQTATGLAINEGIALTIPAFFHAIRLYGQVLGSLDFNVVENMEPRGQRIAREHPVHRLLHDEPNEYQDAAGFWETLIGTSIAWGNAYAYIERNGNYRPTALLPLLPSQTTYTRVNGQLRYRTVVDGQPLYLEPYEIYHLRGFGFDGVGGVPLVRLMRDALALTKAEEAYAAAYFGNGATPGGIITVPQDVELSDKAIENLRKSVENRHGGLGRAFRPMILENGLTFTPYAADADKAQLVPARQFSLVTMAQIVGLAPHLIYDLSRSTYSNIEHNSIEAHRMSFRPVSRRIEQQANTKLLYESEKWAFECRQDLNPLLAGDSATQAQVDKVLFDCLAITPNEIRAKHGRNPKEGGDELYLNTAYLPLPVAIKKALAEGTTTPAQIKQAVGEAQAEPATDTATPPADPTAGEVEPDGQPGPDTPTQLAEDIRAALTPVALDTIGRLVRREAKAAEAASKKPGYEQWVSEWTAATPEIVADAIAPIITAATKLRIQTTTADVIAADFAKASADALAKLGSAEDRAAVIAAEWGEDRAMKHVARLLDMVDGNPQLRR